MDCIFEMQNPCNLSLSLGAPWYNAIWRPFGMAEIDAACLMIAMQLTGLHFRKKGGREKRAREEETVRKGKGKMM